MCTILYDVIKTVHLSLQAWHTRLFTDSIYNICWILHRGNRRRIRLCNCLLTRCACSRATAVIQKAWSKHMKFFLRIHTAHVRLERVVLTREANVWKRRSFDYHTTGQTAAHFRQATCWARNSHPLVCFCATLDYHAQIGQCAPPNLSMPSEIILWYSYSASFKNQTETLIDLLH